MLLQSDLKQKQKTKHIEDYIKLLTSENNIKIAQKEKQNTSLGVIREAFAALKHKTLSAK